MFSSQQQPSTSIPQAWIEAEENISTLVSAMITALNAYGCGGGNNNSINSTVSSHHFSSKQQHLVADEVPSAHDTIGFMKSAVNILLQLWPEKENNNGNNG